jgi:serine/threonine-protein kinase
VPEGDPFVIPDLQRIGKYDVLERIADGGFATLYRARDPFLKRLVAIKVCASEDPELRQQFLREAEIAGNLDHPSIVRTFDFGFDQVGPYLVQEYLRGEDLSQLIARRAPLSPRRKLDLLIQVAEGLSYSHAQRVLHLDIKPANVRVIAERQAKILDFGIARLATSDAGPQLGGMVGTAGYLPPEQVLGKAVDARADIFAFGALAYELLTYRRPYAGGTMSELLKRVLETDAEPMTRHWPGCSDALDNLIGRCLRRSPGARYASFEALLPELVAARSSFPETPERESAEGELGVLAASTAIGAAATGPVVDPPPLGGGASLAEAAPLAPSSGAAIDRLAATASTGPAPPIAPVEAAPPAPPVARRRSTGGWVLLAASLAGLAVVAVLALFSTREPAAPPPPPVAVQPPPVEAGPAPGVLLVTAAPWGEVARVVGADGAMAELPADRATPLRLWVAPGRHDVEVALAAGEMGTCQVEVVSGGTHVCHVEAPAERGLATEYWKEMGWWQ